METNSTPQQQLDRLAHDREVVAERVRSPWWVHVAYGVLVVLVALGGVYVPDEQDTLVYAGFVLAWVGLATWQARGWGVNFRARGNPTSWAWGLLMLLFAMGAIVVSLGAHALGADWVVLGALVVCGVGVTLISYGLERGLRQRVRGEA